MQEIREMRVQPLGQEDSLEKGMPTHFSILAWRIPWTEEPGELQSMGSQRVRKDWTINTHTTSILYIKVWGTLQTFTKAMATHSSTLARKIPWAEESGRLQSTESLRVGHDWATSLSLFTFMHQRRKWQPPPVFLPGESQGWGSWWAAIYGVAQSRTRLKWLSSSSRLSNGHTLSNFSFRFLSWEYGVVSVEEIHINKIQGSFFIIAKT